jgi:hypothetical protein
MKQGGRITRPICWTRLERVYILNRGFTENEWDDVWDAMDIARRPELFETARMVEDVKVYRFQIKERSGIKHMGLPPEFKSDASGSN